MGPGRGPRPATVVVCVCPGEVKEDSEEKRGIRLDMQDELAEQGVRGVGLVQLERAFRERRRHMPRLGERRACVLLGTRRIVKLLNCLSCQGWLCCNMVNERRVYHRAH